MRYKRNRWFGLVLIAAIIVTAVFSFAENPAHITQAQSGGALGYSSKVYGSLSAAMPQVTYSFSGNSGDFVVISADSWAGTLDIQIDLVTPDGVILDQSTYNTSSGDSMGAYLPVSLPDAGIYLLRLSGENGTTGDYLLTLLGRSAAASTPLVYGQAVDVTIPQDAPSQFYTFETENCPTTLVVTNPSSTFPFAVKVRDQRGQTVAFLRGGDQTEDWVTVQPNSGRYEVEVHAAEPGIASSIRLLVTCSGDNPGCPAGAASLTGTSMICTPCPGPTELISTGGCPDLQLSAQQDPLNPQTVTVSWNPMSGADEYAVYVTGYTPDGGEAYLTHADWVPGNPTQFAWTLPAEGYLGFDFTLRILAGDSILCSQSTHVDIRQTESDCPTFGLNAIITDPSVNAVALSWTAGLGADQFDLDIYSILDTGEEYSGRLVLPGDATARAFDHFPPHLNGVRFVLWMWKTGRFCSNEITIMFEETPLHASPICPNFNLTVASNTNTQAELVWTAYPGADGYVYLLMDESRNPIPGHSVIMPTSQLNLVLTSPPLEPGTYIVSIGPWNDTMGVYCTSEVTVTFAASPNNVPCEIRADREGVEVRVGPGQLRSVFTYLNPGIEYQVVGQAADEDGNLWWELDKTQFAGHEAVISLWVEQADGYR